MLRGIMKVAAVTAASAVMLPYMAAIMCNLLYGWPQVRHRYRRAFNPRKVYAMNLCIIQSLMVSLRYASLFLQWKAYYRKLTAPDVVKDKDFGKKGQKLDLYFPRNHSSGDSEPRPVIVFAYGGAWGSGNKKMYGLLCSAVANKLEVIVCCPNHSTYPQGYVDDMVQDMIECMRWLHENVQQYNGDKDKIILLGHSSGANLCALTMLELFRDTVNVTSEGGAVHPSDSATSLQFRDRHFTGNSDNEDKQSSGSADSFQVVDDPSNNGSQTADLDNMAASAGQFINLQTQKSETEMSEGSMLESEIKELTQSEISGIRYRGTSPDVAENKEGTSQSIAHSSTYGEETSELNSGEVTSDGSEGNDSVVATRQGQGDMQLDSTLMPLSDIELRKSLKAVIGIAGVYHIGDHFLHESKHGVEDISCMTRAMRGPEHFDRFSPTLLVRGITASPGFPKVVLLHGTEDYAVPLSSTTKFSDELERVGGDVTLRIIPNCDHYEICMDLMKPNRNFHHIVMKILDETVQDVLS